MSQITGLIESTNTAPASPRHESPLASPQRPHRRCADDGRGLDGLCPLAYELREDQTPRRPVKRRRKRVSFAKQFVVTAQ
mmetsp:Transcript_19197/g.57024  ORF Transcript_19197/g.57024 Transcript_19197/m.57024 type:complete len:80 (-) Transcript_19197:103-342(-)